MLYINCNSSSVGIVLCLCFGKAKLRCPEVVLTECLMGKNLSGIKSVPQQHAGSASCDKLAVSETVLQCALYKYFSHSNYKSLL